MPSAAAALRAGRSPEVAADWCTAPLDFSEAVPLMQRALELLAPDPPSSRTPTLAGVRTVVPTASSIPIEAFVNSMSSIESAPGSVRSEAGTPVPVGRTAEPQAPPIRSVTWPIPALGDWRGRPRGGGPRRHGGTRRGHAPGGHGRWLRGQPSRRRRLGWRARLGVLRPLARRRGTRRDSSGPLGRGGLDPRSPGHGVPAARHAGPARGGAGWVRPGAAEPLPAHGRRAAAGYPCIRSAGGHVRHAGAGRRQRAAQPVRGPIGRSVHAV